jgi:hypothetical protein
MYAGGLKVFNLTGNLIDQIWERCPWPISIQMQPGSLGGFHFPPGSTVGTKDLVKEQQTTALFENRPNLVRFTVLQL